ncbi:spore germination protein [Terrilactibacillus sp. S3-3]|nr:spore germination protein [Terrilactibacillus sp. S3-3]
MDKGKPASKRQKLKKPLNIKKNLLDSLRPAEIENKNEQQSNPHPSATEDGLHQLFANCADVHFQTMAFGRQPKNGVLFISCEGLIDKELLNQSVYLKLERLFQQTEGNAMSKAMVLQSLHLPDLAEVTDKGRIIEDLFSGKLLLFFKTSRLLFSADIAKRPQRKLEGTKTEITVNGPKDNFIEDLAINIALVRKRLNSLIKG